VTRDAVAFWVRAPNVGELRSQVLRAPGPGEVLVQTLRSAVSRGTEALVFRGEVPARLRATMRAPFQEGEFPGPVKYGYLNVGVVEEGPARLVGRTVFSLYPHQSRFIVPAEAVTVVPEGVPAARAVLAGSVETALNALWDAPPLLGDCAAVVGAGLVGCCVARLLARIPGVSVTVVDVAGERADIAAALGVAFARPEEAPTDQDVVFHTSATAAGLQTALDLAAADTSVLELSWYGDRRVEVSLGGRFHTDRLGLRASQVGTVASPRRGRRTTRERLALALELLQDPAFDALLTGTAPLADLPAVMARIAGGDRSGVCHSVTYPKE
jgi:NADPH:quinone reductase-like Zn-dependent oxidoreductase